MTDQPTRPDLDDKAEIAKLRGLLAKENARANAAIDREETAERAALEAQEERDKLIRWHREDETALAEMRDTVQRLRAELETERKRYKAGLRRADEHVNAMNAELKRYADGEETPVLWSVYNAMHLRAANAEALIATVRATHKSRTERHGSGCVQCGIVWPCPTYKALDEANALQPAAEDTLPAWLYQRFAVIHGLPAWDRIDSDDRAYWAHQAAAVRRAVARGGFKTTTRAAVPAVETGR